MLGAPTFSCVLQDSSFILRASDFVLERRMCPWWLLCPVGDLKAHSGRRVACSLSKKTMFISILAFLKRLKEFHLA